MKIPKMTLTLNDIPEISKRITNADFPYIKILYKILYNEEAHSKSRSQVRKFKNYAFDPSMKEYQKFLNQIDLMFDLQPIAKILGLPQRRKDELIKAIPEALSNLEKLKKSLEEEDDENEQDENEIEDENFPTPFSYQDLKNEIKLFDGKTYSITKWIRDIEDKATLIKLTEIQKLTLARIRLTGIAKTFYENSPNKSWNQLKEIMKKMFSSRTDTTETQIKPNRPTLNKTKIKTANENNEEKLLTKKENEKIKEAEPEQMKTEEAHLTNAKEKDELTGFTRSLNENPENDSRLVEKEKVNDSRPEVNENCIYEKLKEKEKSNDVNENFDQNEEKKIDSKTDVKYENEPEEAKSKDAPEIDKKPETPLEDEDQERATQDEKRIAKDAKRIKEVEERIQENKEIISENKEIISENKENSHENSEDKENKRNDGKITNLDDHQNSTKNEKKFKQKKYKTNSEEKKKEKTSKKPDKEERKPEEINIIPKQEKRKLYKTRLRKLIKKKVKMKFEVIRTAYSRSNMMQEWPNVGSSQANLPWSYIP